MNPILSNAIAELEVVQSRLRDHRAACLSLQLDELEIKDFIARARRYERPTLSGQDDENLVGAEGTAQNASNSGDDSSKSNDLVTTPEYEPQPSPMAGKAAASIPPEVAAEPHPVAKAVDEATSGSAMSEPLAPASGPQEAEAASRVAGDRAPAATSERMDVTAGETAPTLYERVKAAHAEHPAMTAREIAELLDAPRSSVSVYLPKVKREAVNAALKADVAEVKEAPASLQAAKETLKDRIIACLAEHPDWSDFEIAAHLGARQTSVSGYISGHNMRQRPAIPERELPTAPEPRAGEEVVVLPEVLPNPLRREAKGTPVRRPNGVRFRLTDGKGNFLHMSGEKMTAGRAYAWVGTEAQLLNVRQRFPIALDLIEEVVE
ncbi:hypothetical protein [Pelagibacterium lacus]|uniref:Uncharacterized protein n=1 Tax=Pelagibacterium lacus TaxID=2282655 RepID=A0A369VZ87_9HYPH|nr:hypothetical protein [Pelagibacterium lacus]RDE07714.1 hypothetical protein DVH29_15195 [Pelagibacterium lacus]